MFITKKKFNEEINFYDKELLELNYKIDTIHEQLQKLTDIIYRLLEDVAMLENKVLK